MAICDRDLFSTPFVSGVPRIKTSALPNLKPVARQPIRAAVVLALSRESRPISCALLFVVGDDIKILLLLLKAAEEIQGWETGREDWV